MLTDGCLTTPLREPRAQRGFTLVELVLVLTVGGLVLGLVAAVGTRLQRQLAGEANRIAANEQLAAAAELLPLDLRATSPAAGDIAEASDSSIQLRSATLHAVVCGGSATALLLAPYLGPAGRAITPSVQGGDTLWILAVTDSGESWRAARVNLVRRVTSGCAALDAAGSAVFDVGHLWSADLRDSVGVVPGTIVRATRPVRFSLYRAGDGRWYLGMRTWSAATMQFATIQPVSGPYAGPGAGGTRFEFFDDAGRSLTLGAASRSRIARVELSLVGEAPETRGAFAIDSLRVVVALRNR